jgi:hypothetical protein
VRPQIGVDAQSGTTEWITLNTPIPTQDDVEAISGGDTSMLILE